jgi:uncharacterized protein (TIGR02996 family)
VDERAALMRAVCENPDEDTPRLVFADWLQENGEPKYAEFVRLQVRHAELLRYGAPDTEDFARKARELWLRFGVRWQAALPQVKGVGWHNAFFRGFVERAIVSSDAVLVQHADAIFGQPLRQLVIARFDGKQGFAALSGLRHLKTLLLGIRDTSAAALEELLRCDHLSETVLLQFHFTGLDGENYLRELRAKFGKRLYNATAPLPGQ